MIKTWLESNAKLIADIITAVRASLIVLLPWLGWTYGIASLPAAIWLMMADWTGDAVDGAIARRNRPLYYTWLGDHDLEIDMLIAAGLLVYLTAVGFVSPLLAGMYVLVCLLMLWHWRWPRALGMLAQAPVYGWFTLMAVHTTPETGRWLLAWMVMVIIITWPRFPQEVVPNFLKGMNQLFR